MSTQKLNLRIPPHVLMQMALFHRLPTNHKRFQRVEKKVRNELAGFHGETRLLYPLNKFPSYCKVLPNVRLYFYSNYFQMDFLLITSKFILILESKYYSDDLLFDDKVHQVIQHKEQNVKVFEDPVLQVEEQAYQLSVWLDRLKLPKIPIEYYVVMTNPQTRLRINPTNSHHAERVISLQRLPSLFRELLEKHSDKILSAKDVNHLTPQISQSNKPYLPNILKRDRIDESELKSGVFCTMCGNLGMEMIKRRWQCPRCGARSGEAHGNTLKDYYLLQGNQITNREFRKFTGLQSRHTAASMLRKSTKSLTGTTYAATYQLSYDYEHDFEYLLSLNKLMSRR